MRNLTIGIHVYSCRGWLSARFRSAARHLHHGGARVDPIPEHGHASIPASRSAAHHSRAHAVGAGSVPLPTVSRIVEALALHHVTKL